MRLDFDWAVLTAAQIHQADQQAEHLGIAPHELMQRAGAALTAAILQHYPKSRCLLLCGPGNNGGDGFVVAQLLKQRGWPVAVATATGQPPVIEPAAAHARAWSAPLHSFAQLQSMDLPAEFDLLIDAGFGVGLNRQLDTQWQSTMDVLNNSGLPIIAVDIPTGIGGSGSLFCERPIQAVLTLALFKKKLAHLFMPARAYCGAIQVCDIGLGPEVLPGQKLFYENAPGLWQAYWQATRPGHHGHKYQRGHVLVLGGEALTGAAVLSALGAAYAGAGLVSMLCPPAVWPVYAAQMRSIMVRPINSLEDFSTWVQSDKTSAVVLGPGAIHMTELPDYLTLLLESKKACVLDAEALNIMAAEPQRFLPKLHKKCILTPHAGEFQRLFGLMPADSGVSGPEHLRQVAHKANTTVVLKGAETMIAHPDGQVIINTEASPYLATAGSGDVLAGVMATFLAQQVPPLLAAAMAVWLHGHAAKMAGPGLIADDLPQYLVKAQHSLEQQLGQTIPTGVQERG